MHCWEHRFELTYSKLAEDKPPTNKSPTPPCQKASNTWISWLWVVLRECIHLQDRDSHAIEVCRSRVAHSQWIRGACVCPDRGRCEKVKLRLPAAKDRAGRSKSCGNNTRPRLDGAHFPGLLGGGGGINDQQLVKQVEMRFCRYFCDKSVSSVILINSKFHPGLVLIV